MWEIPGVEYVYAMAGEGMTLVTVRFKVGENQDRAREPGLRQAARRRRTGRRPAPCRRWSSRTRSTTCRSWRSRCTAAGYGSNELRAMATHLEDEIAHDSRRGRASTSSAGEPPQLRVDARPGAAGGERGDARRGDAGAARRQRRGCRPASSPRPTRCSWCRSARRSAPRATRGDVVVADARRRRSTCANVATVVEAPGEATDYVTHAARGGAGEQAVTIAVAKRPGANATDIAHAGAGAGGGGARAGSCPPTCTVDVTRDYGETAQREGERADPPPAHRDALRHGADRALPRLARGAGGAGGGAGHARAHAVRVLRAGLHAQPDHPLRADLLDRHPGGRRHRGGGEHLPPPRRWADRSPDVAAVEGVDEVGQPDHPRHLHRHRGHPADGVRVGADGPLHAADPGRRLGGDAGLARRWRSSSRRTWRSGCCEGHVAAGPQRAPIARTSRRSVRLRAVLRRRDDAADGQPARAGWPSTAASWCCCSLSMGLLARQAGAR